MSNPLPMWVYSLKTLHFLEVNRAAVRKYGYTRREFLRMKISDIRPAEEIPRLWENIREKRPQWQSSGPWKHRLKNGEIIEVEISSHRVNFTGQPAALVVALDVSERLRARTHIHELASIVEQSQDAIFTKTLDGILTSWNRGAESIYGYQAGEIIGQPVTLLMPPDRQHEFPEIMEKIRHGRKVEHFETERIRKDGVRIAVSVTISPLRDERGTIYAASTIARDITERNRTQTYARELAAIVENAEEAIYRKTPEGIIVSWNKGAENVFGYQAGEILGRSVRTLIPPDRREEFDTISESLRQGQSIQHYETERIRRDGVRIAVFITVSPIRDELGRIIGNSTIAHDVTEQKRLTEHILYQANLVSNATDAIIATDTQFRVRSWNPAAESLYGWSAAEVTGLPLNQFVQSEFINGSREESLFEVTQHGVWRGEVWQTRRDGTKVPILSSVTVIRDHKGDPMGYAAVNRDITDLKRAEEALRFENERFQRIIDSNIVGIILADSAGRVITANDYYLNLLGVTREDFEGGGVNWREFTPPEWIPADEKAIRELREQGVCEPYEKEYIRADGTRVPVYIADALLPGPGDQIAGFVLDISDRKRAEEQLTESLTRERLARAEAEKSRERLGFLAEASALLSETFDYLGRLKQVAQIAVPRMADWCAIDVVEEGGSLNRVAVVHSDPGKVQWAYEIQHRYPPDPAAPYGVHNVVRTGRSELYPVIPESMLAGAARDEEHLNLIRGLGFNSAMVVPFQAGGRVFGVVTLVMAESGRQYREEDLTLIEDLAHRAALLIENARLYEESHHLNLELEERVRERTAELEAINKELEAFSYSVSHDLRAPLRHIAGFVELLLGHATGLDDASQHYLHTIAASAKQMGNLIDELLAFSRKGRAEMYKTEVNFNQMIDEVIRELKNDFAGRDVVWAIAPLPPAHADRLLLKTVWTNLISNALKFTGTRPQATIEVGYDEQNPHETVFFVRDNGVGFEMEYAGKLFGLFQRLHRVDEFEGTGVGLANVRRIIHRHGGRTWAEGHPGSGATFYFSIPKTKEGAA